MLRAEPVRKTTRHPRRWTGDERNRLCRVYAEAKAAGVDPPSLGELGRRFGRDWTCVRRQAYFLGLIGDCGRSIEPPSAFPRPWPGDPKDPACRFDGERDHKMAALLSLHQEPRPMYAPVLHPSRSSAADAAHEQRAGHDL